MPVSVRFSARMYSAGIPLSDIRLILADNLGDPSDNPDNCISAISDFFNSKNVDFRNLFGKIV